MLLKDYYIHYGCLFCNNKPRPDHYGTTIAERFYRVVNCDKCGVEIGIADTILGYLCFKTLNIGFYSSRFATSKEIYIVRVFDEITATEQIFYPNYFNLDFVYRAYKNKDLM